jgi:hypothetical protein
MARAHASTVINAPIDQVWARIRAFDGIPEWHPAVTTCAIEGGQPSDQVGAVRKLTLGDGSVIRERLLELSDLGHHYSYSILESPLPVANYRATLRLRRVKDGERTFAEWTATFDADPPDQQSAAEDMISNAVFQGGLGALVEHFGG